MIYYISDTHFGHKSIIDKCSRPFSSVENMDNEMMEGWNRKVKKSDTVYIIGDFACKCKNGPEYYLKRLNGRKILIKGNHDSYIEQNRGLDSYFAQVCEYKTEELDGHRITFCHYPMLEWRSSRKFGCNKLGFLIHGHIHNRTSQIYRPIFSQVNSFNAGADINGYVPVSFEELEANNEGFKLSTMRNPIDKAGFLCRSYHKYQHDKSGRAYAEHPIYVASRVHTEACKIVALLHDTLEDTNISEELIGRLFGREILEAIRTVTHQNDEDYFAYIERVKKNPLARTVKIEDLRHNMELSRLPKITAEDTERNKRYQRALDILLK